MLGIIIANWNGEKLIEQCLKSFEAQQFMKYKLYIVDNGSNDNSINIINKYRNTLNLELIKNEINLGFAKANNIGIKKAFDDGCKYIMTLNNDTELKKNSLENAYKYIKEKEEDFDIFQLVMINFFERNHVDCLGIKWDKKLLPTQIGYGINIESINNIIDEDIMGASAGAAIYSRKCLERVQLAKGEYFCNDFFAYYEDVDLAIRLKRAGYNTGLIKNSIVYHVHSATSKKSNGFKEYYLYRNMLVYTKRNQKLKYYIINSFSYYKIIIANILKNLDNTKVLKKLMLAIVDGTILAIKTSYN